MLFGVSEGPWRRVPGASGAKKASQDSAGSRLPRLA